MQHVSPGCMSRYLLCSGCLMRRRPAGDYIEHHRADPSPQNRMPSSPQRERPTKVLTWLGALHDAVHTPMVSAGIGGSPGSSGSRAVAAPIVAIASLRRSRRSGLATGGGGRVWPDPADGWT